MQYVPRNNGKQNEMNHSTISFVCALYYDADMCNKQNKSRRFFRNIFNVKVVIASTNKNNWILNDFQVFFRIHPQRL